MPSTNNPSDKQKQAAAGPQDLVRVVVRGPTGEEMASGPGFFLAGSRFVVADFPPVANPLKYEVHSQDGEVIAAARAGIRDRVLGLALLRTEPNENLPRPFELCPNPNVRPSRSVLALDHDTALGQHFTRKEVQAISDIAGGSVWTLSPPVSLEAAGTPVLDADGSVLGVVARFKDNGNGLAVVASAQRVAHMMRAAHAILQGTTQPRQPAADDPCASARILQALLAEEHDGNGAALDLYRDSVADNPSFARAHLNLGRALARAGDRVAAVDAYSKAISLEPGYAKAFHFRAIAHYAVGDTVAAYEDWDRAIELAPSWASPYYNRGLVQFKGWNLDGALEDFTKALELDPVYVEARLGLGETHLRRREFREATRQFAAALRLDRANASAWLGLGRAFKRRGALRSAVRALTRTVELNPQNANALLLRGTVRGRIGELGAALQDLDNAARLAPRWAAAYAERASVRLRIGDATRALEDCGKALELRPDLQLAIHNRKVALAEKNKKQGACAGDANPAEPDAGAALPHQKETSAEDKAAAHAICEPARQPEAGSVARLLEALLFWSQPEGSVNEDAVAPALTAGADPAQARPVPALLDASLVSSNEEMSMGEVEHAATLLEMENDHRSDTEANANPAEPESAAPAKSRESKGRESEDEGTPTVGSEPPGQAGSQSIPPPGTGTAGHDAPPSSPEPRRRLAQAIVQVILLLLVLGAGAWGTVVLIKSRIAPKRKSIKSAPPLVSVVTIALCRQPVDVNAMGTVTPARVVVLQPEVSGRIIKQNPHLVPGARFKAGEEIARIDPRDHDIAVEQARTEVARARSGLALEKGRQAVAKQEWELLKSDVENAAGNSDLALRKPQKQSAEASLRAAQSRLALTELNLQRTRIEAPFNAMVEEEFIEIGQLVTPQTSIAKLIGTDRFWVMASIPVDRLHLIPIPGVNGCPEDAGAKATIVQLAGQNGHIERQGRVLRLAASLDPKGRMARILIAVEDPLGIASRSGCPLLVNAYVRVRIHGNVLDNVCAVPREALHDGNQLWVAQKQKDKTVLKVRKNVEIVYRDKDAIFVRRGVKPGELVITSRLKEAADGREIRIAIERRRTTDGRRPQETD